MRQLKMPLPDDLEAERRELLNAIDGVRREMMLRVKPMLDRLARIEMARPIGFEMTAEEATARGLLLQLDRSDVDR